MPSAAAAAALAAASTTDTGDASRTRAAGEFRISRARLGMFSSERKSSSSFRSSCTSRCWFLISSFVSRISAFRRCFASFVRCACSSICFLNDCSSSSFACSCAPIAARRAFSASSSAMRCCERSYSSFISTRLCSNSAQSVWRTIRDFLSEALKVSIASPAVFLTTESSCFHSSAVFPSCDWQDWAASTRLVSSLSRLASSTILSEAWSRASSCSRTISLCAWSYSSCVSLRDALSTFIVSTSALLLSRRDSYSTVRRSSNSSCASFSWLSSFTFCVVADRSVTAESRAKLTLSSSVSASVLSSFGCSRFSSHVMNDSFSSRSAAFSFRSSSTAASSSSAFPAASSAAPAAAARGRDTSSASASDRCCSSFWRSCCRRRFLKRASFTSRLCFSTAWSNASCSSVSRSAASCCELCRRSCAFSACRRQMSSRSSSTTFCVSSSSRAWCDDDGVSAALGGGGDACACGDAELRRMVGQSASLLISAVCGVPEPPSPPLLFNEVQIL
eukprot:Rhum_TRINITY_DN15258_c3_g2::Rhum_TRINITY_DN15258_c3_g2_i1::g.148139::m.148139